MGRLAEMQRKLLEVCFFCCNCVYTHTNTLAANDGARGHGRGQRKFGMVRRKGLPELSMWDLPTCIVHQHGGYPDSRLLTLGDDHRVENGPGRMSEIAHGAVKD